MSRMLRTSVLLAATLVAFVGRPARGQTGVPIGPYGNIGFNSVAFTNSATIPASQMIGLTIGTPTQTAVYTTDTATNLCALFPAVGNSGTQNFAWDWYVKNASLQNNGAFIGILAGAGVSMVGAPVVPPGSNTLDMKIQLTNCAPGSQAATITPINPVPAFRIQQFGATTATAAGAGDVQTTVFTWQTPFPDTSYVVNCTGVTPTNVPVIADVTITSATQITVDVASLTASAASFAHVNCVAWHL